MKYLNKAECDKMLKKHGWTVECQSPFEMRHEDGSVATGQAASLVWESVHAAEKDADGLKFNVCMVHNNITLLESMKRYDEEGYETISVFRGDNDILCIALRRKE